MAGELGGGQDLLDGHHVARYDGIEGTVGGLFITGVHETHKHRERGKERERERERENGCLSL